MFCAIRERLLKEYQDAVRSFSIVVNYLKNSEGGEFARRYQESERERANCETARKALDDHVAAHGCGSVN